MREVKFRGKMDGVWWYFVANNGNEGEWSQFWGLVDRKTVGEWIGITDKHGKDIYEDDIVNWLDIGGHKYQVVYEDSGFVGVDLESDDGGDIDLAMQTLEVIGNIWENPELLVVE